MRKNTGTYMALAGLMVMLSATGILSKLSSMQEPLSFMYCLYIFLELCVLGVYAVGWQQVIKRIPISNAFMFKGLGLITSLLFAALIFSEPISWRNVAGAAMILSGIVLFNREDREDREEAR